MSGEEKGVASVPYHTPAFIHLQKLFKEQIRYRLTEKYRLRRGELFLKEFKPGKPVDPEAAWHFAREVLDEFDTIMKDILAKRSAAFWLHIYRRIGVFLSPDHEDKTDPTTLGLVRGIVELAIQKHGSLESNREFADSSRISPNLILGGWMKKGLKALGNDKASGVLIFRKYSAILRRDPVLVIREFRKKDFLGIYEIEGAAYQYWRLTALLRSLGKGALIQIDEEGDWDYLPNTELTKLIVSIDQRNETRNAFSSLMGVWVDQELLIGPGDEQHTALVKDGEAPGSERGTVFFPIYNVRRIDLSGDHKPLGVRLSTGSITNFFPYYFHVGRFLAAHEFMGPEFRKRRGYDFQIFLFALAGLSSFSIFPQRALYTDDEAEREKIKLSAYLQTLTRGYHVFLGTLDNLCQSLKERIELQFGVAYTTEELRVVLDSITLNRERQSQISEWSGGPQSVIIPGDNAQIVDLVSLPSVLQTLFVFMPDKIGSSGTVFEQLFREALKRRGYVVKSGDVIAPNGHPRDLDAGVRIGNRLYLFECVSVERPLDYEIGMPKTILGRIERLKKKVEQAASLRKFIECEPVGRNYDYSSVACIEHFVVSPFVEWVWSADPELWTEEGLSRIISPEEVFTMLIDANALSVSPRGR